MMTESVDILVEKLYSSNDPLCYEAGQKIADYELRSRRLAQDNQDLAIACKMMMDALMEITDLSRDRDKGKKNGEEYYKEIGLRLRECGDVATDTLRLDSVNRAYNGYTYG